MDTSGKDGTIRHVVTAFHPVSCRVESFKIPSTEELAHDYLWRIHKVVPQRGFIGVFNRSHYEDVVEVRVQNLVLSNSLVTTIRSNQSVRTIYG